MRRASPNSVLSKTEAAGLCGTPSIGGVGCGWVELVDVVVIHPGHAALPRAELEPLVFGGAIAAGVVVDGRLDDNGRQRITTDDNG